MVRIIWGIIKVIDLKLVAGNLCNRFTDDIYKVSLLISCPSEGMISVPLTRN
ncbi:MAG TPA: hypothetical protein VGE82_02575 [Nitrososphaera sp.]